MFIVVPRNSPVNIFGGDSVVTNKKKLRLAKKIIDALEPREQPYIEPDSEIPGFGIKVMPSGVKTFVLGYRPMPGGRGTQSGN